MLALYKKAIGAIRSRLTQNEPDAKSAPGRRSGSPMATDGGANSEEIARLRAIITNTYAAALIDLRTNKGIVGDNARTIAYAIVAKTVNKTTGRNINPDFVKQVVSR